MEGRTGNAKQEIKGGQQMTAEGGMFYGVDGTNLCLIR